MSAARTWLMTSLMLIAGGGVGVGLAAATTESSASPPPPTSTTRPPVQVVPTTVAAGQFGVDAHGHGQDALHGRTIDLGPFGGKVVLPPPRHVDKSHGRSVTPTTQPSATTPTTAPHTTTPTTQPPATTTSPTTGPGGH